MKKAKVFIDLNLDQTLLITEALFTVFFGETRNFEKDYY